MPSSSTNHLLALPRELRYNIYDYFYREVPFNHRRHGGPIENRPLLSICSELRSEVLEYMQRYTEFIIESPSPGAEMVKFERHPLASVMKNVTFDLGLDWWKFIVQYPTLHGSLLLQCFAGYCLLEWIHLISDLTVALLPVRLEKFTIRMTEDMSEALAQEAEKVIIGTFPKLDDWVVQTFNQQHLGLSSIARLNDEQKFVHFRNRGKDIIPPTTFTSMRVLHNDEKALAKPDGKQGE